ncbi:kinase-like domain-containing protein [Aspergillus sergii]|uniref:Kinase-like domain-containing protein n=1 Tax=Aspergillus sergii TaxID=1034303 RepID=A0A5N6X3A7_9EURO|nr:kinase-like domain-containing protein [Aspergillus sergii]
MISDGEAMTITGRPHYAAYFQEVSRQILLGLDFLHRSGIIHCDLQPANITFLSDEVVDLETLLEPPEPSPVRWLEGVKADNSVPEYLFASQRRRGLLDGIETSKLVVKIGDLGGAAFRRQQRPVTPTALRAPELIHRNDWDVGIDIWTLGCLIFELPSNEPLFPLGTFSLTASQIDKEHIFLIEQVLDKNNQAGDTFTKYLTDRLPADFGVQNIERLASFLSGMLQENAQKRM